MERTEAQKYKGMIFAIIGGIFWGLAGVFGQYLFVNHGLNAKWLVSVRLLLAGVMLLIPVMIKEKKQVFALWKEKKNIPTIFLFAIFGMGLCQLAYYTAVQFSNAGTATVIQYTGPAMIMVYFCIRYRRKPQFLQVLALIMAMAGVFLLATKGDVTSLNISPTALVWGILSAIALAAYKNSKISSAVRSARCRRSLPFTLNFGEYLLISMKMSASVEKRGAQAEKVPRILIFIISYGRRKFNCVNEKIKEPFLSVFLTIKNGWAKLTLCRTLFVIIAHCLFFCFDVK